MAILKVRDANGKVSEIPAIKGKSAYEYAKDGGYTGTEEEFAEKMANGTGGGLVGKVTEVPCSYLGSTLTINTIGGLNKFYKYTKPSTTLSAKTKYVIMTIPEELRPKYTRYIPTVVMIGSDTNGSFADVIVEINADTGVLSITPMSQLSTSSDVRIAVEWFSEKAYL